jgi:beta-galactosidase
MKRTCLRKNTNSDENSKHGVLYDLNKTNYLYMKQITIILFLMAFVNLSHGQTRQTFLINSNWNFSYGYEFVDKWQRVELPHTWNQYDALNGKLDYYRGIGIYQKSIKIDKAWKGKRLFIKFDGANTVTNLFINDCHVGEHRGGYTAFIFEITGHVKYGEENTFLVKVNNAPQLDIMPLTGDFNIYGGIYRDVHLIITGKACISPLDYASPGVYLTTKALSKEKAEVEVRVLVNNGNSQIHVFDVQVDVFNGTQNVFSNVVSCKLRALEQTDQRIPISISNPRMWNGLKDPFFYKAVISLKENGEVIDQVIQPLGLRSFYVDAEKGFFLNGEHLQLRGINRHQDYLELGSAILPQQNEEDVALLVEMGCNAIRVSHYPQSPYLYDLLDKNGIVTWTEIPFEGPGGYRGTGFVNQPSFRENGKQQLKELIRQNYNHPGICFWGLFNELKMEGDSPVEYLKELNSLAHQEDPSRITTGASFIDGPVNEVSDLIGWNKYFGWYGGDVRYLGSWIEDKHKSFPGLKICISEYGAGASIYHHEDSLVQPVPNSYWHPEAWQAYYHEVNWKIINEHPYIWGSFIWNLTDFSAAHRTEGDRNGRNDKGLVTYDRKVKKDAYWFYKANWNNTEPVLYIANRRYINRTNPITQIKVYSNLKDVELKVNGKSYGKINIGTYATYLWNKVRLLKGQNLIEVLALQDNKTITDSCTFVLE